MSGEQQPQKMEEMEVKARDPNSPEAKADAARQAKLEAEAKAKGMTVEQLEARQRMIAERRKALREAANFGMVDLVRQMNAKPNSEGNKPVAEAPKPAPDKSKAAPKKKV